MQHRFGMCLYLYVCTVLATKITKVTASSGLKYQFYNLFQGIAILHVILVYTEGKNRKFEVFKCYISEILRKILVAPSLGGVEGFSSLKGNPLYIFSFFKASLIRS